MNCTHVEKLIALHVENDLNGEQERAVAGHLTACPGCRALADEYRASQSMLRLYTPPEFDNAFFDGIRRNVREQIAGDAAPSIFARLAHQLSPRRMAFAASLALLLLVFGATALRRSHERPQVETRGRQLAATGGVTPGSELRFEHETGKRHGREFESDALSHSKSATAGRNDNTKAREALLVTRRRSNPPASQTEEAQRNTPDKFTAAPVFENANSVVAQSTMQVQDTNAAEIAQHNAAAATTTPTLRIELQTGDPNIRIIWLSPVAADSPLTK